MTHDEIELEALRLFRIVHGKGDCGSTHAYHAQNPALAEGWEKLARHVLRRVEKAGQPIYGPRSEDC